MAGEPLSAESVEAIKARLATGVREHDRHPDWPCEHWGCDDVERLLATLRAATEERDALRTAFCQQHGDDLIRGARYSEGVCLHCQGERHQAERDAATERAERAEKALKHYGFHDGGCEALELPRREYESHEAYIDATVSVCTCGLAAALARAAQQEGEPTRWDGHQYAACLTMPAHHACRPDGSWRFEGTEYPAPSAAQQEGRRAGVSDLVQRGMAVVHRLLAERRRETDLLTHRYHEWSNHPITLSRAQDNVGIFTAGYRLGVRGAHRLEEAYWTEERDEDGIWTHGPRPGPILSHEQPCPFCGSQMQYTESGYYAEWLCSKDGCWGICKVPLAWQHPANEGA